MLNTRTRTVRRSLQEGQAIVLIALLILVLFGMLGLAIDSGRGYVDRRDQQTAVDAAALAAGDWYENFPTTTDLWGKVIPNSVVLYENNLRIYTGVDAPGIPPAPVTRTVGIAPNLYTQYEWDLTFQNNAYQLQILATNTQFNGYEFEYKTTHNLPLAFIQIFGGSPSIVVGADATSIVGNQRQTPALLTLSTGPCATKLQGAGQLTMLGDAYTNGSACVDANLHLAGNCYAVDPTSNCGNATYYCYGPGVPPYQPNNGACNPGDVLGGPIQPAPSLPDPGYLSTSVPFYNTAGNSYNRGNWTEMTPGTWNNFSISSGGCYFLDAGIYQWNGGYTSHGAMVSNELKPPGEVFYQQPGTGTAPPTTFWGGQGCTGGFSVAVVPAAPGAGIKHNGPGNGRWGVEVTSGRYDRFLDNTYAGNACLAAPGCWRESAPSVCQSINEIDGNNQAIDVAITSNAPGAEYYSVYINPAGCLDDSPPPGGTRKNFSYYGTFLAPGWTDSGPGTTPTSSGLGPWLGVLGNGRYGWTASCTNPLVTICGLNTNTFPSISSQCPFYNTLTQGCAAPWDESKPHCFLTCALNTVPQDNADMNLQYPPFNGGDLANENLCQYTPQNPPGGDQNAPCTAAKVTPGAVQFWFPAGNNCLDQNGNGSTHVFSGEQYNWIVIYQMPSSPAGVNCPSQKLNGNAFTQYIGTIYSPTAGWDILGSDTSPLAGQVIAWTATVTGSGNAGIDFNPNYSPAPPAARLIN